MPYEVNLFELNEEQHLNRTVVDNIEQTFDIIAQVINNSIRDQIDKTTILISILPGAIGNNIKGALYEHINAYFADTVRCRVTGIHIERMNNEELIHDNDVDYIIKLYASYSIPKLSDMVTKLPTTSSDNCIIINLAFATTDENMRREVFKTTVNEPLFRQQENDKNIHQCVMLMAPFEMDSLKDEATMISFPNCYILQIHWHAETERELLDMLAEYKQIDSRFSSYLSAISFGDDIKKILSYINDRDMKYREKELNANDGKRLIDSERSEYSKILDKGKE